MLTLFKTLLAIECVSLPYAPAAVHVCRLPSHSVIRVLSLRPKAFDIIAHVDGPRLAQVTPEKWALKA